MSFMDNLGKMAGDFLGGATPQQAADAASDHVANADPNEVADGLTQSVGNMNTPTLSSLGQQLLQTYTNHASFDGDTNTATQEAGVSQASVAAGDPGAVGTMLQFAKGHPEILQTAASAFMQRNPGALASLAPSLLQGIMGRFGGGA